LFVGLFVLRVANPKGEPLPWRPKGGILFFSLGRAPRERFGQILVLPWSPKKKLWVFKGSDFNKKWICEMIFGFEIKYFEGQD